ncbi:hypothetical protein Lupro_06065 [Lutibacter profundi]|uniref:Porin n=1 Tax=Lutibacter profundi TaxID=1622118 RepID=A0A0X8G677_9FLAO|nr:putative porin [Lutibacter profundi]AMC10832.1 hypothetical protein Lupro_06065 [Lutibacter profundi]
MKKIFFVTLFVFFIFNVSAQRKLLSRAEGRLFENDTTSFNEEVQIKLDGLTKYTDYKIISINNDTTLIDTTLTLKKYFKFNYLRKDNFELLPFHNQGQTFNKLGYNFQNNSLFPTIGANAKQFNYYKIEDIYYYNVPTPTSEILYRSGLEQGQVLDAFLTMNTSKQFNFSLAYKGLRSLGKYRNTLASHGNFRATFNYHTKNEKYFVRGHFSSFDLTNNENGGLTEEAILNFESNDPNYIDRARLEVNFIDTENLLEGKRYYMEQLFTVFSKNNNIEKHNTVILNKLKKYNAVLTQIENLKKDTTLSKNKTKRKVPKKRKKPILNLKTSITKQLAIPTKNNVTTDSLSIAKLDSIKKINSIKIDSLLIIASKIKTDSTQLITLNKKSYLDVKLGHTFMYETKHYRFKQASVTPIFGEAFNSTINDHTSYQKSNNQFFS